MDRIIVEHRSTPGTRTKERPSAWRATCSYGGKTWKAESRAGATHELARVLKTADLPDAEFEVHENGRPGFLLVPSFYGWAEWAYSGEQRIRYAALQAKLEALAARKAKR